MPTYDVILIDMQSSPSHISSGSLFICYHTNFCIIQPRSEQQKWLSSCWINISCLEPLQYPVPIPVVDRGRGDPRNFLGVIIDRGDNNLYTTAVKTGILINIHPTNSTYAHNAFYHSRTPTKTNRYLSTMH